MHLMTLLLNIFHMNKSAIYSSRDNNIEIDEYENVTAFALV